MSFVCYNLKLKTTGGASPTRIRLWRDPTRANPQLSKARQPCPSAAHCRAAAAAAALLHAALCAAPAPPLRCAPAASAPLRPWCHTMDTLSPNSCSSAPFPHVDSTQTLPPKCRGRKPCTSVHAHSQACRRRSSRREANLCVGAPGTDLFAHKPEEYF